MYTSRESVAIDVAMNHSSLSGIHGFTAIALNSLYFISLAVPAGERMTEYLVAAIAYGKDSRSLIIEALVHLSRRVGNWNSESAYGLILLVSFFTCLSCSPFMISDSYTSSYFHVQPIPDYADTHCYPRRQAR